MPTDLIIRNALVYDGEGGDARPADVAVEGDRITGVAPGIEAGDAQEIDATGLAVTPGFINALSHSYGSVLMDGRAMSELVQGVTTQMFGEGYSMGPLTDEMKAQLKASRSSGEREFEVPWTRLSEYLAHCETKGVAQNVCSLVGATTVRINVIGHDDRRATPAELDQMAALVDEEMADGALGVGSALIYPPGSFAPVEELIAISKPVGKHGGRYFSHMRSEGDHFLDGVDELLRISEEAGCAAELWHLKAAGPRNWPSMKIAIEKVEAARSDGRDITADIYPYVAGGTALRSAIPPRFHDGGTGKFLERLRDPAQRAEMRAALTTGTDPAPGWENLYGLSGGASGVLIASVDNPDDKKYQGMTLAAIAEDRGVDPVDALLDLVDSSPATGAMYFIASEDNLRMQMTYPWVSVGSDAAAVACEEPWTNTPTHPRTYGTFARFLGRYSRDEGLMPFGEAVRRMTSLPADNLGLVGRGRVREGDFADLVVLDPTTVIDLATYENPHQYSVGVRDVVVNGRLALRDGHFTGDFSGRALKKGVR